MVLVNHYSLMFPYCLKLMIEFVLWTFSYNFKKYHLNTIWNDILCMNLVYYLLTITVVTFAYNFHKLYVTNIMGQK